MVVERKEEEDEPQTCTYRAHRGRGPGRTECHRRSGMPLWPGWHTRATMQHQGPFTRRAWQQQGRPATSCSLPSAWKEWRACWRHKESQCGQRGSGVQHRPCEKEWVYPSCRLSALPMNALWNVYERKWVGRPLPSLGPRHRHEPEPWVFADAALHVDGRRAVLHRCFLSHLIALLMGMREHS